MKPFTPQDFTEPCEDCESPAGQFCRPNCPSGYTAEDYRRDAEREQTRAERRQR